MQITMTNSQIQVQEGPDGSKLIVVMDQSGNQVVIPLPAEAAQIVSDGLRGGVAIAHGILVEPKKVNGKLIQ